MVRLISVNTDEDLARRHFEQEVRQALIGLTANLMRVSSGGGAPDEIEEQVLALAEVLRRANQSDFAPSARAMRDILLVRESPLQLRYPLPQELNLAVFQDEMVLGGLEVAAGRLLTQHARELDGRLHLHQARHDYNRAERQAEPRLFSFLSAIAWVVKSFARRHPS